MVKKALKAAMAALSLAVVSLPAMAEKLPGPVATVNAAAGNTGTGGNALLAKQSTSGLRLGEGVTMGEKKSEVLATPDKAFSRARQFKHRFYRPENASNELVVLLHGSGGNETSLVPLASKVWPRAVLLGVRGRILQDGGTRWYKRITPVTFDQKDVKLEADAFVMFLSKLAEKENLDLSHATFLGYSNGANLLAATMFLHPDLVKRAILMRSMPVLDNAPMADLSKARVLAIPGAEDKLYSPFAPALSAQLRSSGALVDAQMAKAGHMLGEGDATIIKRWLAQQGPDGAPMISMQSK